MEKMYVSTLILDQQQTSDYYVPKPHPKSIRFSGPTIWNNLQPDARLAKSLCNLSSFTKRTTKISNKVICDYTLCIYYYALCCVLNVYTL